MKTIEKRIILDTMCELVACDECPLGGYKCTCGMNATFLSRGKGRYDIEDHQVARAYHIAKKFAREVLTSEY